MTNDERIQKALDYARRYGGIDGDHHKTWVIDQMVRALTEDDYGAFVAHAKLAQDGSNIYSWEVGIPP